MATLLKGTDVSNTSALEQLGELRHSIDNLDAALIHLLAERFKLTRAVGHLKAAHDLPPGDSNREEKMIARLRNLARESNLDPDFAEKLLRFIIDEVICHHNAIKNRD
ncbi:MAG: chorismate mutase [Geminicoccaceae bacterium]|nr:chorismate mutase [Geminicoccaceae bacterium]MCB9945616.1 chorismate mutase [Geminicoccaceae bacterium]